MAESWNKMFNWSKLLKIGSPIAIVAITASVVIGYITVKEKQIHQLEEKLSIAESRVLTDTLTIEAVKVVETVDTTYITRDKTIDKTDTLIQVRNDTVYAEIMRTGTAYFDTTLTPGRNRIKLNMEFDYPVPQLRLMAGYSFYQKPQKRFGFGLFIGSGVTGSGKFDFMLGIGLAYQIKSF